MSLFGFDVLRYLEDRGIYYTTEGKNISSEEWVGVSCPFCGDRSNHLGINRNNKAIHCWRCNPKTKTIRHYIQQTERCSWSKIDEIIEKFQDRTLAHLEVGKIREPSTKPIMLPKEATKHFPDTHIDFLNRRGFPAEQTINRYDLYACRFTGNFKYRLIAPVYLDNELVTFVGRDITNQSEDRYKNAPIEQSKLPAKETLYNIDSVKDTAIIVEGITDVWRMGDGCVATFGTVFTDAQVKMFEGVKRAFIMFDSEEKDSNAPIQAEKLGYALSSVVPHVEVLSLEKGDPADLSVQEVAEIRYEIFGRFS